MNPVPVARTKEALPGNGMPARFGELYGLQIIATPLCIQ